MARNAIKLLCFAFALTSLTLVPACGGEEPAGAQAAAVRIGAPGNGPAGADACGPKNCAGCCAANGVCVPGHANSGCGQGGVACQICNGAIGIQCAQCGGPFECRIVATDPNCIQ